EDDEARDKMIAFLKEQHEIAYAQKCRENYRKEVKRADLPIAENDDGETVIKFKLIAGGVRDDGSTWIQKPMLYNSVLGGLEDGVTIGPGSRLIVAYTVNPWYVAGNGAGISLRPKGIQVLELVDPTGGVAYGFQRREGRTSDPTPKPNGSSGILDPNDDPIPF